MKRPRTYTPEQRARKNAYNSNWQKLNREKAAEAAARWRAKNPEKAWHKLNPEKSRASVLAWRSRNPEKAKAITLNWEIENHEKVKARKRAYHHRHPEKAREWVSKNHEKNRLNTNAWRKAHPDKTRMFKHRRRARKETNSTPEQIKAADQKIIELFSVEFADCPYCRRTFATATMHVDHILAIARGGAHAPENIYLACASCNVKKGNKILGSEWKPKILA